MTTDADEAEALDRAVKKLEKMGLVEMVPHGFRLTAEASSFTTP